MTYTRDEWDALICTLGDDDAAMIRQLLAESEWQPIETAPRDGTWVLCMWEEDETPYVAALMYDCDRWYDADGDDYLDPTHWRPLPAPPKGGAG
jgi:hypothetical protein